MLKRKTIVINGFLVLIPQIENILQKDRQDSIVSLLLLELLLVTHQESQRLYHFHFPEFIVFTSSSFMFHSDRFFQSSCLELNIWYKTVFKGNFQ